MSNYFNLLKVFIATAEITSDEKKRSKLFYKLMGAIVVLLIMLPVGGFVGFITNVLTVRLMQNGGSVQSLEIILHIITILSVIFGINVVINIFYFSNDMDSLLPLPLKPHEIVGAKFTYAILSENIMEFILVLGASVGFMTAYGFSPLGIVSALLGIATLPVLPLALCGILCVIFMYFARGVKNKETISRYMGIGTTVLIVGVLVVLVCASQLNVDTVSEMLTGKENSFVDVMNWIFPQVAFMSEGMCGRFDFSIILYILVNVAVVAVFLFLASKMYFKGVSGVNTSKSERSLVTSKAEIGKSKQSSVFLSYLKKEFTVLFKTPPFFMDCIAVNFLWPVFIVVIVILQGQTNFLDTLLKPFSLGDEQAYVIVMVAVIAISVIVTGLNSIASAGITREGKHFGFMKYIPVPLKTQLNAKAMASMLISGVGMILYIIAFHIYASVQDNSVLEIATVFSLTEIMPESFKAIMPSLNILLSVLTVVAMSYFGLYMDSINPKLVWDDEINALRGNYNVFFNMAITLLAAAVICVSALVMLWVFHISAVVIALTLTVIMCAAALLSYRLCMTKGIRNIMRIE